MSDWLKIEITNLEDVFSKNAETSKDRHTHTHTSTLKFLDQITSSAELFLVTLLEVVKYICVCMFGCLGGDVTMRACVCLCDCVCMDVSGTFFLVI